MTMEFKKYLYKKNNEKKISNYICKKGDFESKGNKRILVLNDGQTL